MTVLEISKRYRKLCVLFNSFTSTFTDWVDALDEKITDVFQDNGVLIPRSPNFDSAVEAQSFLYKFGTDEEKKLLIFNVDDEIEQRDLEVGDVVQLMLKVKTWSRGWGLDIQHVIYHSSRERAEPPSARPKFDEDDALQFSSYDWLG